MEKRVLVILIITIMLILQSIAVFADKGTPSHIYSGGYPTSYGPDLHFVMWYGNTDYQQNILKAAAEYWNNISSNVNLHYGSTNCKLWLMKSESNTPGVYGETFAYRVNNTRVTIPTEPWYTAHCKIYDNNCELRGMTRTEKKATVAHEEGHALSMGHTNDDAYLEIMDTGVKNYGIQYYDKWHLRCKWGW